MYQIEKQTEYPKGQTRYIVVHPDDAEITAKALIDHIEGFYKRIPVHFKIQDFGEQKAAFLWSGDPQFYFGVGEGRQVPKYAQLLDVDMRTATDSTIIHGKLGETVITSGQAAIVTPISRLPEFLPKMYEKRAELVASGEAIIWSGYDKKPSKPAAPHP